MSIWAWKTDREVDSEVTRALSNYRRVFAQKKQKPTQPNVKSRLCSTCSYACSLLFIGPSSCSRSKVFNRQDDTTGLWYMNRRYIDWDNPPSIAWSKSKSDFAEATNSNGCHLCIIIAHACDKGSVQSFARMEPHECLNFRFAYRTLPRDPDGKLDWGERVCAPIMRHLAPTQEQADDVWLRIRSGEGSGSFRIFVDLRMQPIQAGTTTQAIKTLPAAHSSTGNQQNFRLASLWIKACEEDHPMCKAFRPRKVNWRPSRLIYVGPECKEPRLNTSSSNIGTLTYVALSYCWGTSESVVLTSENLAQFQQEIPMAILPATIRDAIDVTRELGYEYLWVDALCIMQDSQEDWKTESPQMADLYGLAAVTLVAASNSGVNNPLYCRRDPRTVRSCAIDFRLSMQCSRPGSSWVVYPSEPERLHGSAMNNNPLTKRAWTLQERILSPRTLVFTAKQIMWSCVTIEASETFPSGLDPGLSSPLTELRSLAKVRQRLMKASAMEESMSEFWNDIVHMYSKAQLTVSSDKLVAVQGIAKRLLENFKTSRNSNETTGIPPRFKYVAGIWRDDHILRNLLWRAKLGSPRSRPAKYRAPSWSWASLDGELLPFQGNLFWAWNKHEIEVASIEEIHVEPLYSNITALTGQVAGGYIDIRCFVRRCYLFKGAEDPSVPCDAKRSDAIITTACDNPWSAYLPKQNSAGERGKSVFSETCMLDCPDEVPDCTWTEVYCVPLQLASFETDRYENTMWETYEGLILLPVDDSGHGTDTTSSSLKLRRIGLFSYDVDNHKREASRENLFGVNVVNRWQSALNERTCVRVI